MLEEITNMPEKELDEWEEKMGFQSLRRKTISAFEEFECTETEEQVLDVVLKNPDYLKLVTTDGEREIVAIYDDAIYSIISNANRLVIVGNEISKLTEDYVVSTDIKNLEKIKNITNFDIPELEKNEDIRIKKFKKPVYQTTEKTTNCGMIIEGSATRDPRWCNNDRRIKLKISLTGTSTYYTMSLKIWGQRKYSCIWAQYSTAFTLSGADIWVNYRVKNGSGNWVDQTGHFYYSYQTSGNLWYWYSNRYMYPNPAFGGTTEDGFYIKSVTYATASHRGMNGIWGTVACN